jgi:hypothetical protein
MKEPPIDAEHLAAFLEGRLGEDESGELIERLEASEDQLESFADAAAVAYELGLIASRPPTTGNDAAPEGGSDDGRWEQPESPRGASTAPPGVDDEPLRDSAGRDAKGQKPLIPMHGGIHAHHRARWTVHRRWYAAAAGIAAIAVGSWLFARLRELGSDPADGGKLLASAGVRLPPGWDGQPWTATRGATEPLSADARAARLGARLTDLEVAVAARDSGAAVIAGDIAFLLSGIDASGPLTTIYEAVRRRAGEPADQLTPLLEDGRDAVARLAGAESVALGTWAEAARLAAATRNVGFFRSPATRLVLGGDGVSQRDPTAARAAQRIRALAAGGNSTDWTTLESATTELLRDLTR